jgi:diguanylate cyclase (GGDEF)-like protein
VGQGIVNLYLVEGDGGLRLAATSLAGGGLGGEQQLEPGTGIDGEAVRSGRPALLRREDGRIGYAALPLLAGSKLIGLLSLQAGQHSRQDSATLESWQEIAAAAAETIARTQQALRLATRAQRSDAISEISMQMLTCEEPNELARLASSSAARILEADHAILRLRDPQTRRYSIESYFGAARGATQEALFRLDKAVTVNAIRRNAPQLIRDAALDSTLSEYTSQKRSVLSAPLMRAGQVVGSISVYDKVALEDFFASCFDDEDLRVFSRFVAYLERALDHALLHSEHRQHRKFDEETGLPNESYLAQRLHEEISRAAGRSNSLALCSCRLENRQALSDQAGAAQVGRVIERLAETLRAQLRNFDVLARQGRDEFVVLMPEPGPTPGERVFELARAVADAISKDEELNQPIRVGLAFGYSVHPADGHELDSLLTHARKPRLRMP